MTLVSNDVLFLASICTWHGVGESEDRRGGEQPAHDALRHAPRTQNGVDRLPSPPLDSTLDGAARVGHDRSNAPTPPGTAPQSDLSKHWYLKCTCVVRPFCAGQLSEQQQQLAAIVQASIDDLWNACVNPTAAYAIDFNTYTHLHAVLSRFCGVPSPSHLKDEWASDAQQRSMISLDRFSTLLRQVCFIYRIDPRSTISPILDGRSMERQAALFQRTSATCIVPQR